MKVLYMSDRSTKPKVVDLQNVSAYELIEDAPFSTHRKYIAGRQYDIIASLGAGQRITAYDSHNSGVFGGNIIVKNPEGDITAEDIAHISKNIILCNSSWVTWAALVNVNSQ